MTNEESQAKMIAILKKHGLEYPTLGEDWGTAFRKLNTAFELFDARIKMLEEMTASNFKEALDYLKECSTKK